MENENENEVYVFVWNILNNEELKKLSPQNSEQIISDTIEVYEKNNIFIPVIEKFIIDNETQYYNGFIYKINKSELNDSYIKIEVESSDFVEGNNNKKYIAYKNININTSEQLLQISPNYEVMTKLSDISLFSYFNNVFLYNKILLNSANNENNENNDFYNSMCLKTLLRGNNTSRIIYNLIINLYKLDDSTKGVDTENENNENYNSIKNEKTFFNFNYKPDKNTIIKKNKFPFFSATAFKTFSYKWTIGQTILDMINSILKHNPAEIDKGTTQFIIKFSNKLENTSASESFKAIMEIVFDDFKKAFNLLNIETVNIIIDGYKKYSYLNKAISTKLENNILSYINENFLPPLMANRINNINDFIKINYIDKNINVNFKGYSNNRFENIADNKVEYQNFLKEYVYDIYAYGDIFGLGQIIFKNKQYGMILDMICMANINNNNYFTNSLEYIKYIVENNDQNNQDYLNYFESFIHFSEFELYLINEFTDKAELEKIQTAAQTVTQTVTHNENIRKSVKQHDDDNWDTVIFNDNRKTVYIDEKDMDREISASSKQRPTSASSQQRPASFQQRPASFQPTSSQQRPTSFQQRPASFQQRPASFQQRPTSTSSQQIPASFQPTSASSQPTSSQQRPTSTKQKGISPDPPIPIQLPNDPNKSDIIYTQQQQFGGEYKFNGIF